MLNINKNLAQEIVNAVSTVVDRDINFIDKNGIIIGSTNKDRFNLFHEAGYEAIKTGNYIIVERDDQYKGSREGINYPIKINNVPIGVIGITGNPKEVNKFGFLVTKITEVFIKEQQLNYKYEVDKQKVSYVIKSLIYNEIESRNDIELILEEFNINKNKKLSVVILKINKNSDISNLEATKNEIKQFLYGLGILFNMYIYPNEIIALINEEQSKLLKNSCRAELLKYKIKIHGGIGRFHNIYDLHNSYKEALMALRYSRKKSKMISDINELNLEMLLESVDESLRKYFVDKTLTLLSDYDIQILKTYYKNNMSLKLTSEELFIHKNTLQYKLEKINTKTGFNPREFEDSVALYIATLLMQS